jgi:hypothetical protein
MPVLGYGFASSRGGMSEMSSLCSIIHGFYIKEPRVAIVRPGGLDLGFPPELPGLGYKN